MCFTPFYIFLQLLHSLFVLVLFLLSWSHSLPTLLSDMLKTLTLHCCYCLLKCNYLRPVIHLCCTVYLYVCNRRLKKGDDLMNQNLPSFYCLGIITSIMTSSLIISIGAYSSSVLGTKCKNWDKYIKNWNFWPFTNKSIIRCKNAWSRLFQNEKQKFYWVFWAVHFYDL